MGSKIRGIERIAENKGKERTGMTRIILIGCNGRMGKMIRQIVEEDAEAEIAAGVDLVDDGTNSFPVFQEIASCDTEADAIIDFSSASGFEERVDYAVERKLPLVECSTGLSEEQTAYLREKDCRPPLCQYVPWHQSAFEVGEGSRAEAGRGGI